MTTLTADLGHQQSFTDPLRLPRSTRYDSIKAVVEFAAVLFFGVLAAPFILLTALLVKLNSRGPEFYSQTRLGRFGRPYTMLKLRTMLPDCETHSGPCWSTAGDPRITKVGRFLRRTHFDELPQLWNVLRGEMSLVGPRPERPEFIPQLEEKLPLYRSRLLVRPGVTGLAQVLLPPDTDLASVRRKLAYDLFYVRNCSPWLDLKILVATVLHVAGVPYEIVGKIVSLPSEEIIEAAYRDLHVEHATVSHVDICPPTATKGGTNVEMAHATA